MGSPLDPPILIPIRSSSTPKKIHTLKSFLIYVKKEIEQYIIYGQNTHEMNLIHGFRKAIKTLEFGSCKNFENLSDH